MEQPPKLITTQPPERLPFNEWNRYIRREADKQRNANIKPITP
jgi:hypothetical protein